ncbi:hypothetical protein [Armatimonas sp.]|uniref:hypothetical protein n=1 Tax=Armatimonas sp. TaxID=1872638 RepID=UPI003750EA28
MTKPSVGEVFGGCAMLVLGAILAVGALTHILNLSAVEVSLGILGSLLSLCCVRGSLAIFLRKRGQARKLLSTASLLLVLLMALEFCFLLLGWIREIGPLTRYFAALSVVLSWVWAGGIFALGQWIGRQQDPER